jgi:hypothetical protein
MSAADEKAALANFLQAGTGVQVYTEPDAPINPPCMIIAPPTLSWTVFNGKGPDQAKWPLYLIVPDNGGAAAALDALILKVCTVLPSNPDAPTITDPAVPTSWRTSGATLPAYLLTLEGSL